MFGDQIRRARGKLGEVFSTGSPFPVIKYEVSPAANIGKFVDVAIPTPVFIHDASNWLLDCNSIFVRAASMSNPFGASVTGSWSRRAVSAVTVSISPAELTLVAMLALVNVMRGPISPSLKNMYGVVMCTGDVLETIMDSFPDLSTAIAHP